MPINKKTISRQKAEANNHFGEAYEGYVEEEGYQFPVAHFFTSGYFQESGFCFPQFANALVHSPEAKVQSVNFRHKVMHGETLTSISRQFGISSEAIMDANPILKTAARKSGDLVLAGEELILPEENSQNPPISNDRNANSNVLVSSKTHNGKFRIEAIDVISLPCGSLSQIVIQSDMDAVTGFWGTRATTGLAGSFGFTTSLGMVTVIGGEIDILKDIEASSLEDWANKSGLVSVSSGQLIVNYSKISGFDPRSNEEIWLARGFGYGFSVGWSGSKSVNEYQNGNFYYRHDRHPNEVVLGLSSQDSLRRAANDHSLPGRNDFLRKKNMGEKEIAKYK